MGQQVRPCVNCSYYHDNYNDTTAFDGFTTPLTATYSIVPGLTYHLKLLLQMLRWNF